MSQRVIERIKKNLSDEEIQQRKRNRRSKLFYVTCDYIEVNGSENGVDGTSGAVPDGEKDSSGVVDVRGGNIKKSGLVINVQSEPMNLFVDGNSESGAAAIARKKRNRKSKLFYVSCDQINVNSFLEDSQVIHNSYKWTFFTRLGCHA